MREKAWAPMENFCYLEPGAWPLKNCVTQTDPSIRGVSRPLSAGEHDFDVLTIATIASTLCAQDRKSASAKTPPRKRGTQPTTGTLPRGYSTSPFSPGHSGAGGLGKPHEIDELGAIAEGVISLVTRSKIDDLIVAVAPQVGFATQELAKRCNCHREADFAIHLLHVGHLEVVAYRYLHRSAGLFTGQLVPDLQERIFVPSVGNRIRSCAGFSIAQILEQSGSSNRRDFVNRRDRVAGPNHARVDFVVGKILTVEHSRLVADETIFGHARGIEFDLDLYILGNREERCGDLVYEHLACFVQGVNVGGHTIAVLRKCLHQGVVVVVTPDAQHRQVDTGIALALDVAFESGLIRDPDVEVPVRAQDDAVNRRPVECSLGHPIGLLDASSTGSGALRVQAIDGAKNFVPVQDLCRLQNDTWRASVGDDTDRVGRLQSVDQHAEGIFEQRQAVVGSHGPGGVNQQHEVCARTLRPNHIVAFDSNVNELVRKIPW